MSLGRREPAAARIFKRNGETSVVPKGRAEQWNLTDAVDGILVGKRYLIHDRDPV
jgi:hypothetical protein